MEQLSSLVKFEPDTVDRADFLALSDVRKTNDSQLWIAGCSISHGIGVDTKHRYGTLVSTQLNTPVSFLTHPGSSVEWAADQILRSDIRSNDIVVWGITSHERMSYFTDNKVEHLTAYKYSINKHINNEVNINLLTGDNRVYHFLTRVFQVINFCEKINAKLIVCNLLNSEGYWALVNTPNYVDLLLKKFHDTGFDNLHPGPRTHQYYADEILKKIKELL